MKSLALILFLAILPAVGQEAATPPALAPTPCTIPCPPPPPPTPPFTGRAELSFVATSGNTSTQSLGVGIELSYKPIDWSFIAKGNYIRAEANGEENARSIDASFRAGRTLTAQLEAFGQVGYLQNTYAGIDSQYSGDAGLAFKVLTGPTHHLKAEGSVGYLKENHVLGDNLSFALLKAGLGYRWAFSKTADFTNDATFTYDLKDSTDWRFGNKAALTGSLTSALSMKLSWTLLYLNAPPLGFGKTSTISGAVLVAKF